jgi:hypothetical protein
MLYYAALFVAVAMACALFAAGGPAALATSKFLVVLLLLCAAMAGIVIARMAEAVASSRTP